MWTTEVSSASVHACCNSDVVVMNCTRCLMGNYIVAVTVIKIAFITNHEASQSSDILANSWSSNYWLRNVTKTKTYP